MNKQKLLQSSLNQHICLQTSTNKKVARDLLLSALYPCFVLCSSPAFPLLIYFVIVHLCFFFSTCCRIFICLLPLPESPIPPSSFSSKAPSILERVFFEITCSSKMSPNQVLICPVMVEIRHHPTQWEGFTKSYIIFQLAFYFCTNPLKLTGIIQA